MKIEMIKLQELVPYENNPRDNDKSVPKVKESIEQFGFKVPIIIDKEKIIVCGHTRYKAAKELKLEEVPCIMADDLNEEQIQAFRLADNKVGEESTWIFEKLESELQGITSLDMSLFGFTAIEEDEPEVIEDGYDEELPEEPKTKLGQIWQLGQHRLMCGDSTSSEDVKKLMNGSLADLVVTDPPYNVNVSNSQGMTIKNDNMESSEFRSFLTKAFKNLSDFIKSGGGILYMACIKRMDQF